MGLAKPTATERLRDAFEHTGGPTFGAEEEVMVLDPLTFDLSDTAEELLHRAPSDPNLKLEMPASQLEVITPTCAGLPELVEELHAGRTRLAAAVHGHALLAAAGAHPFAAGTGRLNRGSHYAAMAREYGPVARRQLVCGLHVHVGLPGAQRALAVYNALRGHLPELAALGANAPLRSGGEAGMASIRPLISAMLPRQGVPPAYESWEELEADVAWGRGAGRIVGLSGWWWELRLHALLGTIEVRVPDSQSTVADAAAVVTTVCALILRLSAMHDAGELGDAAPSWRIAENRWSAARGGVHGEMFDLTDGTPMRTSERLQLLLEELRPVALELGAEEHLDHALGMSLHNGADRQLELARRRGARGVAESLAASFAPAGDTSRSLDTKTPSDGGRP